MKIVCFLQNAWSPWYAGRTWPRDQWLKALWRSRSGKRLKTLTALCVGEEFYFDNTTPIVGNNPDSVVKPDYEHIRKVITEQKPQLVIGCGKQAEKCLLHLQVEPLLLIPHPACRTLTNKLYIEAARLIYHREIYGTTVLNDKMIADMV